MHLFALSILYCHQNLVNSRRGRSLPDSPRPRALNLSLSGIPFVRQRMTIRILGHTLDEAAVGDENSLLLNSHVEYLWSMIRSAAPDHEEGCDNKKWAYKWLRHDAIIVHRGGQGRLPVVCICLCTQSATKLDCGLNRNERVTMDLTKLPSVAQGDRVRVEQAYEMVFRHLIEDWSHATNLPRALRDRLQRECPLDINADVLEQDGGASMKALLRLDDGSQVESVLMRHADQRNTVCVSSQVGCAARCAFCATAALGFTRNLEPMEILAQVLLFARSLRRRGSGVTNVVFMGMGEPMWNYENVVQAIENLNDRRGLAIGARRISVSTVGIVEAILRLAKLPLQVNLAVSLNAPNDAIRSSIMPVNRRYPISSITTALARYVRRTQRRVMLEYIMIRDVNDSEAYAAQLADLVDSVPRRLAFVNLISYNPTGRYQPSSGRTIQRFRRILETRNVSVTQRYPFGHGVGGACGQLGLAATRSTPAYNQ